jgi:hypothetical protein
LKRTLLVLLVIVVVGALAAGVTWVVRDKPSGPVIAVGPSDSTATTQTSAGSGSSTRLEAAPSDSASDTSTAVVFPLEVDMELLHAEDEFSAPGAPAMGSGAKAQLKGTITGSRREPVRAEIEFVAGANAGRVLYCDASGAFGAQDLYPGLSIVRVTGPGIVGSQREVLLRSEREKLLNVNYAMPAHVIGEVVDAQSKPLAGALVSFDGQERVTDEQGRFELAAVAPGIVLVVVSKQGYAAYREEVSIAVNGKPEATRLQYRLEQGARLQVSVLDAINKSDEALVYILPGDAAAQRKFPWHTKNPVHVFPGGTTLVEDLPSGMVSLRLFHAGAAPKPDHATALLGAGETANAEFHLEPAPVIQGVVTDGGQPAPAAEVVLEAPDRTKAMLSVLGETNFLFLESEVFPNLPPAVQKVVTNGRGEFVLSANESAGALRYVTATSQDGKRTAHAAVPAGTTNVDLALVPIQTGKSTLRVVMPGREQPLPLKITVNGTPRDQRMLQLGRDLAITDLPGGAWVVTVRWSDQVLLDRAPVQLKGEVTLEVVLPVGAKLGQDADTILRSGHR